MRGSALEGCLREGEHAWCAPRPVFQGPGSLQAEKYAHLDSFGRDITPTIYGDDHHLHVSLLFFLELVAGGTENYISQ